MQKDSGTALSVTCDIVGGFFEMFIVELSDENNTLVSQCRCRANSAAKFSVNTQGAYMITVSPCRTTGRISPTGASRWVTLGPACCSIQFFRFCHVAQHPPQLVHTRFSLTDAYYPNLPINEGELKLWQNIL